MSDITVNTVTDSINIYSIPESYKPQFDTGIITAVSQPAAHLDDVAIKITGTGEYVEMDTRGKLKLEERKERHERKPLGQEIAFGRRRFYPNMFAGTATMSEDDLTLKDRLPLSLNTLVEELHKEAAPLPDRILLGVTDPQEAYAGNCLIDSNALEKSPYGGRRQGLMGTNYTGEHGTTSEVLPQQPMMSDGTLAASYADYNTEAAIKNIDMRTTHVVPVNFSLKGGTATDSPLTFEKLMAVRLILQNKHVISGQGELCMAVTPMQMLMLIQDDRAQNSLYGMQALQHGYLSSFFGIRFIVTPDVPIVNIGTSDNPKWVRACPVWRKDAVEFATWDNVRSEIVKLSTHYDTWAVSLQCAYGAGRRRMDDIVTVHCDEWGLSF